MVYLNKILYTFLHAWINESNESVITTIITFNIKDQYTYKMNKNDLLYRCK